MSSFPGDAQAQKEYLHQNPSLMSSDQVDRPIHGGKTKNVMHTYNGRAYVVRVGKRGGKYILVLKKKVYI